MKTHQRPFILKFTKSAIGRLRLFLSITLVSVLAATQIGCALFKGQSHKRGDLARQWGAMMREQQIVPIYPPREDVRIMDMYATSVDPTRNDKNLPKKGYVPLGVYLGGKSVEDALRTRYEKRPPYPRTPLARPSHSTPDDQQSLRPDGGGGIKNADVPANASGASTAKSTDSSSTGETGNETGASTQSNDGTTLNDSIKELAQRLSALETNVTLPKPSTEPLPAPGAEATDESIFQSSPPDRLRHVAFADFSFAKVDGLEAKALFPVQGFDAQVGGSIDRTTGAFLRIGSGESVSLPAPEVYSAAKQELCQTNTTTLKAEYTELLSQLLQGAPKRKLWILVLNEVFYAREIDVTFETKLKAGATARAQMQLPTAVSASTTVDPSNGPTTSAGDAKAQPPAPASNSRSVAVSSPGGSITYVHGSAEGIGLRRTFARPIAVGFRGLALEIQACGDHQLYLVGAKPVDAPQPIPLEAPTPAELQ